MRIALKYKSVVVATLVVATLAALYIANYHLVSLDDMSLYSLRQLQAYSRQSLLGELLLNLQQSYPLINGVLTVALILAGALIINKFTIQNNLFGEATKLPSMLYALVCIMSMGAPVIIMPPMASLFVVAALHQLYASSTARHGNSHLAWSCIYLGVIPLVYPPVALLLPLWVFALLVTNSQTYRDVGVAFGGMVLPLIIALSVKWLFDSDMSIMETLAHFAESTVLSARYGVEWLSVTTLFCALAMVVSIMGLMKIDNMSMRYSLRRLVKTSNVWLLLSLAMIALPSFSFELLAFVAAPVALLLTTTLLYARRAWISVVVLIVLMLCAVAKVVCNTLL